MTQHKPSPGETQHRAHSLLTGGQKHHPHTWETAHLSIVLHWIENVRRCSQAKANCRVETRKRLSWGEKVKDINSHIAGNTVVNCGPWERLVKDRLNSVSASELLAFLLNPVPSAMSPSQVMAAPSFCSLRSKTKESFWTPPLLGCPPPVHNLLLTISPAVTLVAATFISHPNYCKVSNMISPLPHYPLPPWQSSLNTTARVILIKENHIMSFFCSKPSGDFHFIQDKNQSPLNSLMICASAPCCLLSHLIPHHFPPHSSSSTGLLASPWTQETHSSLRNFATVVSSCSGCICLPQISTWLMPPPTISSNITFQMRLTLALFYFIFL